MSLHLGRFCWRCIHNPVVPLTILGLLSWLAYLHLTLRYPLQGFVARYLVTDFGRAYSWSMSSLQDFSLTIFQVLALYILAWHVISRHPDHRRLSWIVLAFGLLFAVTLLFMYPIMASDIFEYIFHSRILVHYGQNPLVVPPARFPGDPFLKTVPWARQASPYGPLWLLLTVPGTLLARDDLILNLFMMRGLAILFYAGCTLVIASLIKQQDPDAGTVGILLFAWNPLVLLEVAGNGHNELIMMFFVLLAIYFLGEKRWTLVLPLLVASVMVKYVSVLLLLPFLLYCLRSQVGRHARALFLVKSLALSALVFAVVSFPFLAMPSGLLDQANFFSLLAVPTLLFNLLKASQGDKAAKTITFVASALTYLPIYLFSLRGLARQGQTQRLVIASAWLILAYLGFASMQFQPWFVVLPIALGIWGNDPSLRRVLLVFTVSALLSYVANFFWVWNFRLWSSLQVNVMFVTVIFVPPLLIGVLSLTNSLWQNVQARLFCLGVSFSPNLQEIADPEISSER